jgi:hypothetical protein
LLPALAVRASDATSLKVTVDTDAQDWAGPRHLIATPP